MTRVADITRRGLARSIAAAALALTGAVSPTAASAHPHEEILWAFPLVEPFFRPNQSGYGDGIRNWFVARLPAFEHALAPDTALDHVLELMQRQDGVCHPLLFRTEERMAFAVFSGPMMMTPSILMITPADAAGYWRDRKADIGLAAESVLASERRAAVMAGRAYGLGIDRLISALAERDRVQFLDEQSSVFAHLERGWADFTFGYASESVDPLIGAAATFAIDGVETGKLAHIGCSDGPVGRALVAEADRLIAEAGPRPAWLRYFTETLSDVDRAAFDRGLKRRAPWGVQREG